VILHKNYRKVDNTVMEESNGNKDAPIWLIGDSAPKRWINDLSQPFDRRHPAVHNIWTPIIYEMQKNIYKEKSTIITDEENIFFIKNAVYMDGQKPERYEKEWGKHEALIEQLTNMTNDIRKYKPKMVITFGAFAFEFIRRCYASDATVAYYYGYWGAKNLGEEFKKRIDNKCKVIPLLHTSISRGKWVSAHVKFTDSKDGNYYDFVAKMLYKRIIEVLNLK
jgi:hypothetical protein